MSGCSIGSVQSNWCQTNLISFNRKIIDFVPHLDFSKAFHRVSYQFLVCELRKQRGGGVGGMQTCLKNYSEQCQRFIHKTEEIKKPELHGGCLRSVINHYEWQLNECTY